ncbi:MAG: Lead, cadmium, zinc and mercury transporting ATPase; Copper-translocating P-type ATPase, partial [uncultured Acetobacteraceae bacterium]
VPTSSSAPGGLVRRGMLRRQIRCRRGAALSEPADHADRALLGRRFRRRGGAPSRRARPATPPEHARHNHRREPPRRLRRHRHERGRARGSGRIHAAARAHGVVRHPAGDRPADPLRLGRVHHARPAARNALRRVRPRRRAVAQPRRPSGGVAGSAGPLGLRHHWPRYHPGPRRAPTFRVERPADRRGHRAPAQGRRRSPRGGGVGRRALRRERPHGRHARAVGALRARPGRGQRRTPLPPARRAHRQGGRRGKPHGDHGLERRVRAVLASRAGGRSLGERHRIARLRPRVDGSSAAERQRSPLFVAERDARFPASPDRVVWRSRAAFRFDL